MKEAIPNDAIVVLEASVSHDDPGEVVGSNIWFVNALLNEYLTADEIAADAFMSYYIDYYLCQVNNGGFSQFVYNSRWSPLVVELVRKGLQALGARRHLEVFEQGAALVESFGAERFEAYLESAYFGDNPERDELNVLNDAFLDAEEVESLLGLNAAWLTQHPRLVTLPSEEAMLEEAQRRGQLLPDRDRRIAEARASEPRYTKLIRALCEQSGQQLDRITGGDPNRVHEGVPTLAWHFLTDQGHHHMIEFGGKAILFRGHSTTERLGEVDAPAE